MPKKSFFRLENTRKEEIYNSALPLYIEHTYEDITMKKVLEYLSMNPGTFYRYFEDKDDLYCYLTHTIVHKRVEFFNQNNKDFLFDFFISGLFRGYDDKLVEPLNELEIKFIETFSSVPEDLLLKVYSNVLKGESFPLIKDALRQMRLNGYLRPDIDDDMISFMFESMQFNLIMFFREYNIKDANLQQKVCKYFSDFMGHGLLDDNKYSEIVNNNQR